MDAPGQTQQPVTLAAEAVANPPGLPADRPLDDRA